MVFPVTRGEPPRLHRRGSSLGERFCHTLPHMISLMCLLGSGTLVLGIGVTIAVGKSEGVGSLFPVAFGFVTVGCRVIKLL